ncbi:hypothetical protein AURDEDRAFT_131617 [Auricularia subglabra TFB-10046 SS5]|uniref:C2H2-type domain-containing protein n=1 Tax=Auricularia subglabra (strain TFB-10046 / SS5) TaxID=717982 RepID=J0WMI9_AURST|nr:hypothetical protein AURDEDRAFT_131617 [Auricularia subglabra TFB-10046 SS5]
MSHHVDIHTLTMTAIQNSPSYEPLKVSIGGDTYEIGPDSFLCFICGHPFKFIAELRGHLEHNHSLQDKAIISGEQAARYIRTHLVHNFLDGFFESDRRNGLHGINVSGRREQSPSPGGLTPSTRSQNGIDHGSTVLGRRLRNEGEDTYGQPQQKKYYHGPEVMGTHLPDREFGILIPRDCVIPTPDGVNLAPRVPTGSLFGIARTATPSETGRPSIHTTYSKLTVRSPALSERGEDGVAHSDSLISPRHVESASGCFNTDWRWRIVPGNCYHSVAITTEPPASDEPAF